MREMTTAAKAGATGRKAQGARTRQAILEAWTGIGGAEPLPLGIQRYLFVTEDPAEARQAAEGLLNLARNTLALRAALPARDGVHLRSVPFQGEPTVEWLLEHGLIGAPAKIAEQLAGDMRLLRPTHYSLYMGFTGLPGAAVERSLTRFGREVLPLLRAAAARPEGMAA